MVSYLEEASRRFHEVFGKRTLGRIKELARYLGRAVPDGFVFQREALRAADLEQLLAISRRHLLPLPSSALDLQADGHLKLEKSGSAERRPVDGRAA